MDTSESQGTKTDLVPLTYVQGAPDISRASISTIFKLHDIGFKTQLDSQCEIRGSRTYTESLLVNAFHSHKQNYLADRLVKFANSMTMTSF